MILSRFVAVHLANPDSVTIAQIALGERLVKDIYEALRAGPGWGKTLFLVAYDDTGGFYDHVIPPHEGVPADESPCGVQNHGCPDRFDFRRLGNRVASFIMSPWIAKGKVIQTPSGPTPTSQFELSSICSTAKTLFNLSSFLTKRDSWAGSFESLLLDTPRPDSDCPMHLPDAPPPWTPPPIPKQHNITCGSFVKGDGCHGGTYVEIVEWSTEEECRTACEAKARTLGRPGCCWHTPVQRNASSCEWITGGHHDVAGQPTLRSATDCVGVPNASQLRGRVLREEDEDAHQPRPRHCPAQQPGTCPAGVSVSQRRKVAEMAARVGVAPPPLSEMTEAEVDHWLAHVLSMWLAPADVSLKVDDQDTLADSTRLRRLGAFDCSMPEWLKAPFRPLKLDDIGKDVVAEEVARTQVFRAGIYCTVPRNDSQCTYTNSSDCSGDGLCVQRDVSYDRHDIFGDGNPYSPKVIGLYNKTRDRTGAQCCGWCSGYANCSAWSICAGCKAPFTDVCFLKTSTAGMKAHPGVISGVRAGTRAPLAPPGDDTNCIPWSLDPNNKNGSGFYWSANTCSMVLSRNDTLVAFLVGAKYGAGFHHQNDIIIRRSFTQGTTWEPFQMLFSPSAFYHNTTFSATVGTVLDRHTGKIWAMLTVRLRFGFLASQRTNAGCAGQQYIPGCHELRHARSHVE